MQIRGSLPSLFWWKKEKTQADPLLENWLTRSVYANKCYRLEYLWRTTEQAYLPVQGRARRQEGISRADGSANTPSTGRAPNRYKRDGQHNLSKSLFVKLCNVNHELDIILAAYNNMPDNKNPFKERKKRCEGHFLDYYFPSVFWKFDRISGVSIGLAS